MILQNIFSPYQQGQRLTPEQMDAADNQATSMLVTPEPGLFSGLSQSFRGLGYGAYKSGSAFLGAASSTVASPESIRSAAEEANEQLAGYGLRITDPEGFALRQSQSFDDRARELRKTAQAEYGIDPSTMGTIASTLHGLFEILPKGAVYSLAGPGMGSVLFGADLGISRAQELKDKGVDEETAATAGLWSFGAGALGLRVPAAFGPNRWISAAGGAGANMLFTAAEMGAISHVLKNQKYDDLAKQYELTVESMGVSGLFGAAAGAFFFRSPSLAARALDLQTQRTRVADAIYSQLRETDTYRNKADLAWKEAEQKAASVMEWSRRTGENPEEILPAIRFDEKGEMSVPDGAVKAVVHRPDSPIQMLKRSYSFDEQLKLWEQGKGAAKFDLGVPSWVLQLFGVTKSKNISAARNDFVHVLLSDKFSMFGEKGKHGIKAEELRGLLIGIQNPIAVFRSTGIRAKPGEQALVLVTELKRGQETIIAPIHLTRRINGTLRLTNRIPSAYDKKSFSDWIKKGLLLGYDAEKGPLLLSGHAGPIPPSPGAIGSKTNQTGATSPSSRVIVYKNSTTVGDVYQKK